MAGCFRPIDKKTILLAPEKHETINTLARATMRRIRSYPTLENFLRSCKCFALDSGLASERCRELIEAGVGRRDRRVSEHDR